MTERAVKILQIQIGGKTFSGVSSYLYHYYRQLDHNQIHFDFLFCRDNSMELVRNDSALLNSKFYVLNAVKGSSNDYIKIIRGVHEVLEKEEYDAVIVNTSIIMVIFACFLGMKGIRRTKFIAHAHNTELVLGRESVRSRMLPIFKRVDNILREIIRRHATFLFACSKEAGRLTFGNAAVEQDNFYVIRNAIDIDAFAFNIETRNKVREEIGVKENTRVYGNVGSFCKRKNQLFLIDVFEKIVATQSDSELWLVGDGIDRELIVEKIRKLKSPKAVRLLGQRNNVNELMQGMDCFVFPTLSEGLGIVAIEAQAAGLPTFVSDGVPEDVIITELAHQIKLSSGADEWASEIISLDTERKSRDMKDKIIEAGYDIHSEAMRYTKLIKEII